MSKGWIGIDLDGTLAEDDGGQKHDATHIGRPVKPMVQRVRRMIAEGKEVKIFTARVDAGIGAEEMGYGNGHLYRDPEPIRKAIEDWTEEVLGKRLEVTNIKTAGMVELWDDRAVQVLHNLGYTLEEVANQIGRAAA